MEKVSRVVQITANVSIILLTVLVSVLLLKQSNFAPKERESTSIQPTVSSSDRVRPNLVGQKAPIQDVDWQESHKTVVLYLSTTCHFCKESTPFYKQLLDAKFKDDFKLVAIFPQDAEQANEYLQAHGLKVDQVISRSLTPIGISGTPTLLLVSDDGLVSGLWRGKLDEAKQAEVLAKLSS
jgi:thiol-disulfide isomerase/thioredoxin